MGVAESIVVLLVVDVGYPLVLDRKRLENDIIAQLIVHRLPRSLEILAKTAAGIKNKSFLYVVVRIQAGLRLRDNQLLVAYPLSFLGCKNDKSNNTQTRVRVVRLKHHAPELESGCGYHGTELRRAAGRNVLSYRVYQCQR